MGRLEPPEQSGIARAPAGAPGVDSCPSEPLAGSYFVAAYPPFACWTESAVERYRRRLARPAPDAALGLYVHLPFCAERCRYCYYLSYDDRPEEIGRYADSLVRELELYAGSPYLSGRRLDFVYFGGGTPSLLSESRIRALFGALRSILPWDGAREVTFECAPRSVTRGKLETLRELGVTRLSLGVQQLDDGVLRASGRVHRVADVERAWEAVRRADFPVVNLDLIAGLPGETDATFDRTIERVARWAPESVTLYLLEIPGSTPLFRQLSDGALPAALPGWETKRRRLAEGFERLERAGYTVRSAYAAVRDAERHRFLYQDEQYRGADLLGLGAASFSYLGGVHHQNAASLSGYLAAVEGGRLPLGRAYALDAEERMVRELVLGLKLGRVDAARLAARHGVDPRERFSEELASLAGRDLARLDDGHVVLTRRGLLAADRLVRELFLLPHREGSRGAFGILRG